MHSWKWASIEFDQEGNLYCCRFFCFFVIGVLSIWCFGFLSLFWQCHQERRWLLESWQQDCNEKWEELLSETITDMCVRVWRRRRWPLARRSTPSALVWSLLSVCAFSSSGKWLNDVVLGFLFIAGTGWQSYSRFKKSGISSAGGWIYGGLSFGFYLGNIYGSVVSARKYNQLHKKRIDEKTHRYLSSLSF